MCTALAQCTAHQCVHLVTFFNGNSRHTPVCTEFLHSFPFMHSCFTAEPKCMLWSSAEHCNSTLDDSSSLNGGRRGNHAKQTKSQGIIIATFLVLILLIGVFCSCYIMSSSILQWGWWRWGWKPTMGYVKKPRAASVTCPHYVCSHPWQCIDGHDDDGEEEDDGHDVHSCHDDRDDTE